METQKLTPAEAVAFIAERLTAWAETHEGRAMRLPDSKAVKDRNIARNYRALIAVCQAAKDQPGEPISEAEETARGENLVKVLGLRAYPRIPGEDSPRFHTTIGTKSALGLYRTLNRIYRGEKL